MHIQKSGSLQDEFTRLSEEAMVLREECIADKCKSLAILNLTCKLKYFPDGRSHSIASFDEDTEIVRQMIEEIKNVSLAVDNSLQVLRSHLPL